MGNAEKASRLTKSDVIRVLDLHLQMNPDRGRPLLVGIDQATGQLFFCSARGSTLSRDEWTLTSGERILREEWRQHRA